MLQIYILVKTITIIVRMLTLVTCTFKPIEYKDIIKIGIGHVHVYRNSVDELPSSFNDYFTKRSEVHNYLTRHGNHLMGVVAHCLSFRLKCSRSPVQFSAGPGDFVGPILFCSRMAHYSSGEAGWFSARTLSFHQCSYSQWLCVNLVCRFHTRPVGFSRDLLSLRFPPTP